MGSESASAAASSAPVLPFANDGSFMEQFLKMQQQSQLSQGELKSTGSSASTSGGDTDFVPSSTFSGAKEGFVFKTDKKGTGYYRDTPVKVPEKPPSPPKDPAKPVILKTKPIINVKKRNPTVPEPAEPKRKKTGAAAGQAERPYFHFPPACALPPLFCWAQIGRNISCLVSSGRILLLEL